MESRTKKTFDLLDSSSDESDAPGTQDQSAPLTSEMIDEAKRMKNACKPQTPGSDTGDANPGFDV